MDDEIEDIIGDLRYTDSLKSIATVASNLYSLDFTEASSSTNMSEKNTLSGKETYVIECDSEDSDRVATLHDAKSFVTLSDASAAATLRPAPAPAPATPRPASVQCTLVAHESSTQTSKTILQLVENDAPTTTTTTATATANNTLETQTSFVSITENKTIEYRIFNAHFLDKDIDLSAKPTFFTIDANNGMATVPGLFNIIGDNILAYSLKDEKTKLLMSESGADDPDRCSVTSADKAEPMPDEATPSCDQYDTNIDFSDFESGLDSDMEEDSLIGDTNTSSVAMSNELKDLYRNIEESGNIDSPILERFGEPDIRRFGCLTPLTEESVIRKDSLMDVTPVHNITETIEESDVTNDEVVFTNNTGFTVKLLKDEHTKSEKMSFRLPPIQNQSCPNSPHLNSLFSSSKHNKLNKAGTLPCLYEAEKQRSNVPDRWELGTKELASGEGNQIHRRNEEMKRDALQLPPIRSDGHYRHSGSRPPSHVSSQSSGMKTSHDNQEAINIKDRIRELKHSAINKCPLYAKLYPAYTNSRSMSLGSSGAEETAPRGSEVVDRGCELLCTELLRKLRSSSWVEVMETLDEIPQTLQQFWNNVTENRTADLIRQVNQLVESARPQVSRSACNAIACILKNTNFTKKPDFYESVTVLLTKTGSYSQPLRRAANVALDEVVCGVDLTPSVTALCIHGVGHASGVVRAAAARLLVVCGALSGGGRGVLRARPATAATARRLALRALAALLEDKYPEARKYAERLYTMLRPLENFEAYYLTDVDVETATRQMKKFDQLLLINKDKDSR